MGAVLLLVLSELSAQSPRYTLTGRHHLSSDARCGSEAHHLRIWLSACASEDFCGGYCCSFGFGFLSLFVGLF